jgi:SHAQKYF class myb-like DNA-binding protein
MECYDPELIKTLFMNVAALWKRVFEVIPVEGGMGVSAELRAFAIHIGEIMQQLLCEYKKCFKGKFDGITLSFNFICEFVAAVATAPDRIPWTNEEHAQFEEGIIRYGRGNWKKIESLIPSRDNVQIRNHASIFSKNHPSEFERLVSIHKENGGGGNGNYIPWTNEEHAQFEEGIIRYGRGNWKKIESLIPSRNNVQIRNHASIFSKNHPSEFERLVSIHKENAVRSLSMSNSTVLTSRSSVSLSSGGGNGNTNVVPLAGITVWNNNNEEKDKKESLLSVHQQQVEEGDAVNPEFTT